MRHSARFLDRTSAPHLITLVLLAGISALSMNIFLPSLPGMAEDFDVPYTLMQQSVSLYLLLSAVLQIVIGPLADKYGRRPVLLVSLVLFCLATLGTIVAPNATVFLVCRMAQAVIAGAMVLSRAIVRDMVPGPEAAAMIAWVTMGMSLVPMIGPVVGGFLDQTFGWQANFIALLVVGLAMLALLWADLGETGARRPETPVLQQFMLYSRLIESLPFWGYSLTAAFAAGTFFAFIGGAPFVGSEIFKLPPAAIGLLFAMTALGYMVGNFFAGRYTLRLGLNKMMTLGTVITTLGLLILAVLTYLGFSSPTIFFIAAGSIGLGNGMSMPNANAGVVSARPDLAGSASGLGGAIMIGAGAGFSALAGTILTAQGTEMPLVVLMLACSAISVITALFVARHTQS